ncbi:MAG: hypothetical protein QOF53_2794 [Nocardioidaceae bacterium]|nr:hypothetical protein [Nocardioidaceae bacterium]
MSLEEPEVWLLMSMTTQLLALLGESDSAESEPSEADPLQGMVPVSFDPVAPPADPILHRLLPDAYRDDNEAAGEFRRLTEADLRATKRGGLSRIVLDLSGEGKGTRSGGVRVDLDEEGASQWLAALTDLRLALGTRIGVTEDMDDERERLAVDSPRYAEIATYDWLSWLQDMMVRALVGE